MNHNYEPSDKATTSALRRIRIDNVDVFLEDLGNGKGKITISDTYDHNYSYFWGSMGSTLEEFICSIDSGYFVHKLIPHSRDTVIDVKKTFAEVRRYIREEIGLAWYQHLAFQADMRQRLSQFQLYCEEWDSRYFVDNFFPSFVDRLDYWLIEDRHERKQIESAFNGITEYWYFIQEKPSREYEWLEKFHGKLKKQLKLHSEQNPEVSDTTEVDKS